MNKHLWHRANQIIEAGMAVAKTASGRNRIENIQLYEEYAESGYGPAEGIALGNWNDISHYDNATGKFTTDDDTPKRVGNALEKLGFELEWEDEWHSCDQCGKLIRTSPDSYSWQQSYVDTDDGITCLECVDPVDHLESLEDQPTHCNTISRIDPAQHGYLPIVVDFEHGMHYGQDADPKLIAGILRKLGLSRFVFNLESTGQFDVRFGVYLHESKADKLEAARIALQTGQTDGPSVAGALERGLREASVKMATLEGDGIKYANVKSDGTADARLVSPEEFVRGIGKENK